MLRTALTLVIGIMLSPILWALATSAFFFTYTLEIKHLNFNVLVDSTIACDLTKHSLEKYTAGYFKVPKYNVNVSCLTEQNIRRLQQHYDPIFTYDDEPSPPPPASPSSESATPSLTSGPILTQSQNSPPLNPNPATPPFIPPPLSPPGVPSPPLILPPSIPPPVISSLSYNVSVTLKTFSYRIDKFKSNQSLFLSYLPSFVSNVTFP